MTKKNHQRPAVPPMSQEAEVQAARHTAARMDAALADPAAAMRYIDDDASDPDAAEEAPRPAFRRQGGTIAAYGLQPEAVATLDPPESGPPTAAELGQDDEDPRPAREQAASRIAAPAEVAAPRVPTVATEAPDPRVLTIAGIASAPPAPAPVPTIHLPKSFVDGPDIAQPVANLSRMDPEWPKDRQFTLDYPWGMEPDPQVGEIIGWNWAAGEVAVVVKQPVVQGSYPWTITVEIQAMPPEWQRARVLDAGGGGEHKLVVWFAKWNRAGEKSTGRADEQGLPVREPFGGWCVVVRQE